MRIGLGVDARLGLSVSQLHDLGREVAQAGYECLWTNSSLDYDPIAMCVAWHATTELPTGVAVIPITRIPAAILALEAHTAHGLTRGAFTLGIGSGPVAERPIAAVRDYVADVRRQSADIPVAIGALGPQMLALAARHAGAAALNWCTPAQIARTRELVGPSTELVMYLRVCVDDDLTAARVVLARQILGYALSTHIRSGPSGSLGYPAHFERMGFGEELAFLRTRRDAGANDDDLARMIPERLLTSFGYAGRGDDAREWLNANAVGLDIALVRVLSVRPGDPAPVRGAITAFAPRTFS